MTSLSKMNSLRRRLGLPSFLYALFFALSDVAGAAPPVPEGEVQMSQEDGAVNLFVHSANGQNILRFSCLNGESLFISLFVADGTILSPDIRSAVPEAGKTFGWLAWHPGQSNIIYAAQPRELLRSLLQYPGGRLVFEDPGQAPSGFVFGPLDQKGLFTSLLPGCQ
jgi:hypothetical protein